MFHKSSVENTLGHDGMRSHLPFPKAEGNEQNTTDDEESNKRSCGSIISIRKSHKSRTYQWPLQHMFCSYGKETLTVLVAALSSGVKGERRKNTAESETHEKETNCVYASSIVEASSKERSPLNHLTHKELLSSVGGGSKREGTDLLSFPVGPEENEDGGHNDTRDHDTEHAVLRKMSGLSFVEICGMLTPHRQPLAE